MMNEFLIMNNQLKYKNIMADIRGKLRFPSDNLSGRASSEETVASAEHPCLSEASWDATASVGLEVARQRQP